VKLLWISPRWPFPADDGAKQASASLLLSLAERGHELAVVTFARERELSPSPHPRVKLLAHHRVAPSGGASRVGRVLGNLLSSLPVSAAPFSQFGLSWETYRSENPQAVVIDGNHGYSAFWERPCPWPLVYRAHNNETSLWRQAAAKSRFGIYFRMQSKRMCRFETKLGEEAGGIAAISPSDAEDFRTWFPRARVEWIPMGFAFPSSKAPPESPLTFGYIGRMDWPPNREGLEWFLEKVWPRVRAERPGVRLKVAGSGDASWLAEYDGFEWLGKVRSVEDLYGNVHAMIAPVHFGSGTKIKVVEAVSHGRAVFATRGAFQGSGLSKTNLALLSDDPGTWVDRMKAIGTSELALLGEAALQEAKQIFGAESAAEKFESLLSGSGV
jgi:glycosyltransferase involved in cell wall biosynthesis